MPTYTGQGVGTNNFAELTPNVNISFRNQFGNAIIADCIGDPNTVALQPNIYNTGCLIWRNDILSGNNLYQNQGTLVSPSWVLLSGGGGGGITAITGFDSVLTIPGTIISTGTISLVNDTATPGASMVYGTNSSGVRGWFPSTGSGTVTSIGATVPVGFSVSGSPITSSGTLGITYTGGDGILQAISGAISPITDGTNGQVLTTDGTGTYSFQTPSGGAPIYPLNQIPFGDGTTAGGITSSHLTYDATNQFITLGDNSGSDGIFYAGANSTGLAFVPQGLGIDLFQSIYNLGDDVNSIRVDNNAFSATVGTANLQMSSTGAVTLNGLAGNGTQIVTVNNSGTLSGTTTIPASSIVGTPTQIFFADPITGAMTQSANFTYDPNTDGQFYAVDSGANNGIVSDPSIQLYTLGQFSGGDYLSIDSTNDVISLSAGGLGGYYFAGARSTGLSSSVTGVGIDLLNNVYTFGDGKPVFNGSTIVVNDSTETYILNKLGGSGDAIVGTDNSGVLSDITIGSGLNLTAGVLSSTGGGTPALTQNQIAFGDPSNLMTSSAGLTSDGATFFSYIGTNIGFGANDANSEFGIDTIYNGISPSKNFEVKFMPDGSIGLVQYGDVSASKNNTISKLSDVDQTRQDSTNYNSVVTEPFFWNFTDDGTIGEINLGDRNGALHNTNLNLSDVTQTLLFSTVYNGGFTGQIFLSQWLADGLVGSIIFGDNSNLKYGTIFRLNDVFNSVAITDNVSNNSGIFYGGANAGTPYTTNIIQTDGTSFSSFLNINNTGYNLQSTDISGTGDKTQVIATPGVITMQYVNTVSGGNTAINISEGTLQLFGGNNGTQITINDSTQTYNFNKLATGGANQMVVADITGNIELGGAVPTGGTYTPTLTNTTNITSSTAQNCQYTQVGNIVTVFGSVIVTTTLAVASTLLISLPIASTFAADTDLNGVGQAASAVATNAVLEANLSANSAELDFIGLSIGGNGTIYFSFSYTVI